MRRSFFIFGIIALFFLTLGDLAIGSNPHGGYTSTSDKCRGCHDLHNSASSYGLLQRSNVYNTCVFCHGIGGVASAWPYAHWPSLNAPGQHSPNESTSGGSGVAMSQPLARPLSCVSCHTPHGNTAFMVIAYSCDTSTTATNHLLRRAGSPTVNPGALPGPGATVSLNYNNQWCLDCHNRAHQVGWTALPHPYNTASLTYFSAGLARTNVNFSMYPVTTSGRFGTAASRTSPLCMQCHEDTRNVETIFNRTLPDWQGATKTNPPYATFPHQVQLDRFRLETGDDMCFNCHSTTELP